MTWHPLSQQTQWHDTLSPNRHNDMLSPNRRNDILSPNRRNDNTMTPSLPTDTITPTDTTHKPLPILNKLRNTQYRLRPTDTENLDSLDDVLENISWIKFDMVKPFRTRSSTRKCEYAALRFTEWLTVNSEMKSTWKCITLAAVDYGGSIVGCLREDQRLLFL